MAFTKEQVSRVWLSHAGLLPIKAAAILNTYQTALNFFEAFSPKMRDVLPDAAYDRLLKLREKDALKKALDQIHRLGLTLVTPDAEDMPQAMRALCDPPVLLYLKGDPALLIGEKLLSVVGTRSPTPYGSMMAQSIGASLGQSGVTVVSGFARGIDIRAQEGAITADGQTIAVMGRGLDAVYPPEHTALFERMIENGGLAVSEYPPGTPPHKYHFPQRNRLISALAQGVVFIEGKWSGGGMITVNHALEQGKEVFVLPGPANCELYEAPHALIRDGARLITGGADILADMGWEPSKPPERAKLTLEQECIWNALDAGELSFDEIAAKTGLSAAALNSNLTIMALTGIIKKSAGRIFIKVKP